jgi:hypothetical protein
MNLRQQHQAQTFQVGVLKSRGENRALREFMCDFKAPIDPAIDVSPNAKDPAMHSHELPSCDPARLRANRSAAEAGARNTWRCTDQATLAQMNPSITT